MGIVVVAITYFSLIIGQLVPKRMALNNAERTAADEENLAHQLDMYDALLLFATRAVVVSEPGEHAVQLD